MSKREAPLSAEAFSRAVRDIQAARRRHKPERVTITRAFGGYPVSAIASTCLDAALDFWAFEPHRPIVIWVGRERTWTYYPTDRHRPQS